MSYGQGMVSPSPSDWMIRFTTLTIDALRPRSRSPFSRGAATRLPDNARITATAATPQMDGLNTRRRVLLLDARRRQESRESAAVV